MQSATITTQELNELNDMFWLKFGIQHCNVLRQLLNIIQMLHINYPESHSLTKAFSKLHRNYSNCLSSQLDSIICAHYPMSVKYIPIPETFQPGYTIIDNPCISLRYITGIFYRSETIPEYHTNKYVADGKKPFCMYVSSSDFEYMTQSLRYSEEHIEYIHNIYQDITKDKYITKIRDHITKIQSINTHLKELLPNVRVEENCIIQT
jgi:hypothetical protein